MNSQDIVVRINSNRKKAWNKMSAQKKFMGFFWFRGMDLSFKKENLHSPEIKPLISPL